MSTGQYFFKHKTAEVIAVVIAVGKEDADRYIVSEFGENKYDFVGGETDEAVKQINESLWYYCVNVYRTDAAKEEIEEYSEEG